MEGMSGICSVHFVLELVVVRRWVYLDSLQDAWGKFQNDSPKCWFGGDVPWYEVKKKQLTVN